MNSLAERLTELRDTVAEQAPEEALEIMARAKEDLRNSGILDELPAVNSELPPFELEDSRGELLRSDDLLKKGPLVVSVYRGVW